MKVQSMGSSSFNNHDRTTTLGSPVGAAQIVNISSSSPSSRRRSTNEEEEEEEEAHQVAVLKKCHYWKRKCFSFSLCPTISRTDASEASIVPSSSASLAHFLAVERRANRQINKMIRSRRRRVQIPVIYVPDEYEYDVYGQDNNNNNDHIEEPNSLFANGHIAPPPPKLREWEEHFRG